jgi:drug/metabolite transporter (DMT)-like permease
MNKTIFTGTALIFCACVIWSLDTLLRYPMLGEGKSVEQIVFFEHLFIIILISPSIIKNLKKIFSSSLKNNLCFFLIGTFGSSLATIFFTKAFIYLNPSIVIVIQKLQVLYAIILSRIILKEKINSKFILSTLITISGAFLLIENEVLKNININEFFKIFENKDSIKGVVFSLLAVIGWGTSTVIGKYLTMQKFSSIEILTGRFFWGFIITSFFIVNINIELTNNFLLKMVLIALVTGLLSMWLYYQGLKKIPAKLCAVVELSFPIAAIIINWIFLNKTLINTEILGTVLILLGVTIASYYQKEN